MNCINLSNTNAGMTDLRGAYIDKSKAAMVQSSMAKILILLCWNPFPIYQLNKTTTMN